jgi:hypothetical protein
MLRFTASRASGLALALTLASVATAAAQTTPDSTNRTGPRRSRSQLPVRKDAPSTTETTPSSTSSSMAPAGRTDTLLVSRTDTTVVMCNCATTTVATAAGEVLPLIPARIQRWFGNGLYVGVGSGAALPLGDMMNSYNPGWGVNVPIGWDPKASPLGVRVNLGYTALNSASPSQVVNDAKMWSAALDAKLRIPFGKFVGATSGAYFVGGGSVHHFTNYNESIYRSNNFVNTNFSSEANNNAVIASSSSVNASQTSAGIHGGVGLSLGVGIAELFTEARYTRVYTPGRAVNYLPIVAGLTFH